MASKLKLSRSEAMKAKWSDPEFRERQRLARTGVKHSPEFGQAISERKKGTFGKRLAKRRYLDTNGYWRVTDRYDHPLAGTNGEVLEHRLVLFDKIGPGEHPCHWCKALLIWGGRSGICADHLDEDRQNNDPNNLVPSCQGCNRRRGLIRDEISGRYVGNGQ